MVVVDDGRRVLVAPLCNLKIASIYVINAWLIIPQSSRPV